MVSFFLKYIHLVGFGFLFLPLSLLLFVVELIELFGSIVFFQYVYVGMMNLVLLSLSII